MSKPTHWNTAGVRLRRLFFSVNPAIAQNNGGSVMLVLSRRNSESVAVGDPGGCAEQMLKVTVLEIGRGKVRLGFEGANDIPVNRWEVWQRMRASAKPDSALTDHSPPVAQ
jgi:carbon storage regulator CsrA